MSVGLFDVVAIIVRPVGITKNHVAGSDNVLHRRIGVGIEPTDLPNVVLELPGRIANYLRRLRGWFIRTKYR